MKKYIFIQILFIFISISCIRIDKNQSNYRKNLNLFPNYLVDFFPNNLSKIYLTSKNVDVTNGCIFYFNYSFFCDSVKKMQQQIERKYKSKYKSNDSLLITIKRNSLFEWGEKKKVYYQNIRRNNYFYYPIPYFEKENLNFLEIDSKKIFSNNNESGLANGFIIYLLDSKSGIFWDNLKKVDYMPAEWKNGYSKGICVNEKTKIVIYWVVVW